MNALLSLLVSCGLALLMASGPAGAQIGASATFITPFPDGDRYRVQVYGDAMSAGLHEALKEEMGEEARFAIDGKHRWLAGLLKADIDEEARQIAGRLKADATDIAIVMLGTQDRLALRKDGRRIGVGSAEWKVEYSRRLDVMMRTLRQGKVGVIWVGLPVMRRQDATNDAEMMNELIRSRALANGARFIDIFASFADEDRNYNSHGPDLDGKSRLLREGDGVHFTWHGSRKLAHFVERELKRAAQTAWDERTIPLAGTEAEQTRIRPPSNVKLAPLPQILAGGAKGTRPAAKRNAAAEAAGGIAADNSQITVNLPGAQGRIEAIKLEIVRPAIPANVLSLIKRREAADKPSQVGDAVMTEILGGITVVSSVTLSGEGASERRRGVAGATSPLHRVLQRGESLPPKPGRSDDLPWPRQEPELMPAALKSRDGGGGLRSVPAAAPGNAAWPGGPALPRRPSRELRRD